MIRGVTGWPDSLTVSVRVRDLTDAETDVAWTTIGVTAYSNGIGYSSYYYDTTETNGHAYVISFKDSTGEYSKDILREGNTDSEGTPTINEEWNDGEW